MGDTPISILYVDDEPLLLDLTRKYLARFDITVETALSGHIALQMLKSRTYDAVVADYQMPGMDGISLLQEVRAIYPHLPFILFTGKGREEVVIDAIENGADFYLQKGGGLRPQFTELTSKIRKAIDLRRAERELCERELRFRSLIQNSSDIIRILDRDGTIIYESPSGSRIHGYPPDSLVGRNAFEYIHPEDRARVQADFSEVNEKTNPGTPTEYRIRRADGTYLTVESTGLNLVGVPGVDGIITTTHPIQTRKLVEDELRETISQLEHAERVAGFGHWAVYPDTGAVTVSDHARTIYGIGDEELSLPVIQAIPLPEYRPLLDAALTALIREGAPYAVEFQIRRCNDGEVRNIRSVASFDPAKRQVFGIIQDITEQRSAETALLQSEERFQGMAERSSDLFFIFDQALVLSYVSPTSLSLAGYLPEDLIGSPVQKLSGMLFSPSGDPLIAALERASMGDEVGNLEMILLRKDRSPLYVNLHIVAIIRGTETVGVQVTIWDISHHKLTEQALHDSEEKFYTVFLRNPVPLTLVSAVDGVFAEVNEAFLRQSGYTRDEVIGRTAGDLGLFVDPSEYAALSKEIREQHFVQGMVLRCRSHDGSLTICRFSSSLILIQGRPHILSTIEDITREKQHEDAVREMNAYLESLIANANVPIIVWDSSFLITRINHSCELLIGRAEQDVLGRPVYELFPPDKRDALMHLLATTQGGARWETLRIDIQHRDGTIKAVLWNSSTIYEPDGSTPLATIAQGRDITSELLLEEETWRLTDQIQENISKLAIINDGIRNPLTIISVYVDQLGSPEISACIWAEIEKIDAMVNNLDREWVSSISILEYLRKNDCISAEFTPDLAEPSEDGPVYPDGIKGAYHGLSRTIQNIEEIKAQLYAILDSIDALIVVVDMGSSEILYLNTEGWRLFGDAVGKRWSTVIPMDQDDSCSDALHKDSGRDKSSYEVFTREYYAPRVGRWFERKTRAIRWTDNHIVRLEIATDITDRKRAEKTLQESEEKFRTLVNHSLDGTFILDLVGGILFASSAAARIVGADAPGEIIGLMNVTAFVTPESMNEVMQDFENVSSGIDGYLARYKILTLKGETRWIESLGKRIVYRDTQAILISIRDVTDRIHAEEILQRRSQELKQIVRNMNKAFVIWTSVFDDQGQYVSFRFGYFNARYADVSGLHLADVRGKDVFEVWPDTEPGWVEVYGKVATTGVPAEFEMYHAPTRRVYHCNAYRPNDSPDQVCVIFEDVTRERAHQEAFDALVRIMVGTTGINALLQIAQNVSSWLSADCVMIGEIQPDREVVNVLAMILDGEQVHDCSYTLTGTPCKEVLDKGFCIFPDKVTELFPENAFLAGIRARSYVGTPLRSSDGQIIGILCVISRTPLIPSEPIQKNLDIIAVKASAEIERTHIEEALQKNQARLADAMDQAQLVHWEYDLKTGQFSFDDKFYALYGTTAAREGGYTMSAERYSREFLPPGEASLVAAEIEKALKSDGEAYLSHAEHRIIRRDGEIRHISVRIALKVGEDGEVIGTYGVNQDITELKKTQEALIKANSQLNLLTSITRHDILNQVAIGFTHLDSLILTCNDDSLSARLHQVLSAFETIQSQIEFTRVYEMYGGQEPRWIELSSALPRAIIPDAISFIGELPDLLIYADPILNLVFSNLLDNSIRHGERVTRIRVSASVSEGSLSLVWEDNGVGIPEDDKEQIFERGVGKNTGLGLFLIREILKLTDIRIHETGVPGTGSRFEILVPSGRWQIRGDNSY